MTLELVIYKRHGRALVDEELRQLGSLNPRALKDEMRLRAALHAWAQAGFRGGNILDFRPLEGPPYFKKMWEARFLKSARKNESVHGYRIFYVRARRPDTDQEAVILLKLWPKSGSESPPAVLDEAWSLAQEVWDLIDRGVFFKPPGGKGIH